MSDTSLPSPGPRRPVYVPPRILTKPGAPPPVPGSIMRSLLSTRGWAILCAIGLLLIGVLQLFQAQKAWRELSHTSRLAQGTMSNLERLLAWTDVIVTYALAGACLFAVPRLFRYSSAIARLHAARRMVELENALRHQRAVWFAFGIAGVLWLISCVGQLAYLVSSVSDLQEMQQFEQEQEISLDPE